MKTILSGLGQISAMGQGLISLKNALEQSQIPHLTERKVLTAQGEKSILVYECPEVNVPGTIPEPIVRRMSRISKMSFAAASEAMTEAFGENKIDTARLGLVVASAFGPFEQACLFQHRLYNEGPVGASPSLFASSVQNSIASQLTMSFKINGPSTTVMTMEQTTFNALRIANDWLTQNIVDHVLVVFADEISSYHSYTFAHQKMHLVMNTQSDDFSTILGEGAVAMVLSQEKSSTTAKAYAQIADIDLFAQHPAHVERFFTANFGAPGQFSRYQKWLGSQSFASHAHYYGGLLIGSAFETLIAALDVYKDSQATSCIQITDHGEAQSIVLTAIT